MGTIAVLDDDPTGVQDVAQTPIVLDWSADVLARLATGPFHVLTNTRAYAASQAYAVTRDAAAAVRRRYPDAQLLLRGDSTLRGHVAEEYDAVREVVFPGRRPPLLLVPALPGAGRVTLGGVQRVERGGEYVPLDETEYARDGNFTYHSARLLDWAEERSDGLFAADNGIEVQLPELRRRGADAVFEALTACAAKPSPSVCAPDAETVADLHAIADGVRAARAAGVPLIVRSAPAFAAVYCSTLAHDLLPVPRAGSLLVVCGSYVPQTTRQLAHVTDRHPETLIEVPLQPLLGVERGSVIARTARKARECLSRHRLAVIATPRSRASLADDPTDAGQIAVGLAAVTGLLADAAELMLFKGGITAAVCIRDGLGARIAVAEGPVAPGVSVWRLGEHGRRCLVFPGNVGSERGLVDIVEQVLA